jgi:hypothetical protein
MHVLHSLVERISHPLSEHHGSLSALSQEWEYGLAVNVTDQYSYKLWFPCLSKLLKEIRVHEKQGLHLMLHLAMRLVLSKLQDTELIFELESDDAAKFIQVSHLSKLFILYCVYLCVFHSRSLIDLLSYSFHCYRVLLEHLWRKLSCVLCIPKIKIEIFLVIL